MIGGSVHSHAETNRNEHGDILDDKVFKLYDSGFSEGDDVFCFRYYVTNLVQPNRD